MTHVFRFGVPALLILFSLSPDTKAVPIYADEVDHSSYDEILRSYVNSEGLVNYADLRRGDTQSLNAYLEKLAKASLNGMSSEQRKAFWINAYNARVLQQIVSDPQLKNIAAQKVFFDTPFPVAGQSYSLNDIQHRILRGKLNPVTQRGAIKGVTLDVMDPRIHFALCDGSRGSPPLKNFAYTSKNIENTLAANSVDFVNSSRAIRIDQGTLIISDLMNRYAEDFEMGGGPAAYLSQRLSADRRPDAAEIKRLLISQYRRADFTYDWTVNDALPSAR